MLIFVRSVMSLCVLAALLVGADGASGKTTTPLLRLVDRAVGTTNPNRAAIVSNGQRTVAYQASEGTLRTVDVRSGQRRDIAEDAGCGTVAAGASRVLLACSEGGPQGALYGVVRTKQGDIVPIFSPGGFRGRYEKIGRYWLAGTSCPDDIHCGDAYLELSTGRYQYVADGIPERDPNTPDLALYDPSRYITLSTTLSSEGPLVARLPGRKAKRVTVSQCATPCRGAAVGSARVTWRQGGRVFAFDLRRGVRYGWRVASSPQKTADLLVAVPTARGAYIAVPKSISDTPTASQIQQVSYRIYRASF